FGITLPFDTEQVTYVWYDALFNYLTVCQNGDENFWPADLHVVGKDIIRFHAIYWPAMLLSAGYELPKQILTTGFFTVDGQKISKSLGNAIDPVKFSEKYSKDLLTLYLLSSFNIGQDGDFDQKQAILTYNAKLANNLGNLVNRVVVLGLKFSEQGLFNEKEKIDCKRDYIDEFDKFVGEYNLKSALDISFKYLDKINKYVDEKEPWKLVKDENKTKELNDILYKIAEGLRNVGLNLYTFFPEKMGEMFIKLGLENYVEQLEDGKIEELRDKQETFMIKEKGEPLFLRFDLD
ncbi:MAG: class I tRNA ligase family protein, partial [Candidatus Gracilibacteria bacterium]